MAQSAVPNVWTQMNYVPPRGQCNFKPSIMSAKCPCLRFMLHPLKSSSSYECDGCAHHASYHSMENKYEDEIRKRWELEAKGRVEQEDRRSDRPRKRLRELEYTDGAANGSGARMIECGILTPDELDERDFRTASLAGSSKGRGKTRKAGIKATATRGAATRAKSKVMEILDDEDVLELD